jgi:hypothetical protein
MSVSCECCMLSDRGLCVGLITRPEESYRVWCVWCVWSWSLEKWGGLGPQGAVEPLGEKKWIIIIIEQTAEKLIPDKGTAGGNIHCFRQHPCKQKAAQLVPLPRLCLWWMTCSFILCTNSCCTLCIMTCRQWQVPHTASLLLPYLRNVHDSSSSSFLYVAKASSFRVCWFYL